MVSRYNGETYLTAGLAVCLYDGGAYLMVNHVVCMYNGGTYLRLVTRCVCCMMELLNRGAYLMADHVFFCSMMKLT